MTAGPDEDPALDPGQGQGGFSLAAWAGEAPEGRVPLLWAAGAWSAGEICNLLRVSWMFPVAGTSLIALVAAGHALGAERDRQRAAALAGRPAAPGFSGRELAAAVCAAGAWVTAAAELGPLGGMFRPAGGWDLLSAALAAGTWQGRRWLRRHRVHTARHAAAAAEAERAARQAEEEARRAWWRGYAPGVGLGGTFLHAWAETLLGEALVIDTRGSRVKVPMLHLAGLAWDIAERENLPPGRVDVFTNDHEPAGLLHIAIRREDPWRRAFSHPAADPAARFAGLVRDPASCHAPACIGVDPETGRPLEVPFWESGKGGRVIIVAGTTGAGKTVTMSCLTERATACLDAMVVQVDFFRVTEDAAWAPACAASALTWEQLAHARRLLQWVVNEITERTRAHGAEAIITPSPVTPLIIVKVDEMREVRKDPVCRELLDTIATGCRGAAICLIGAAQRATADFIGAKIRAMASWVILGRFNQPGEAMKATGGVPVPDMRRYGEGHDGVQCVLNLATLRPSLGRTFKLRDVPDIAAIARARAGRARVPAHRSPGQQALWQQATGVAVLEPLWKDEAVDGGPDDGAGPPPQARRGAAAWQPPGGGGHGRPDPEAMRARLADVVAAAEEKPDTPDISPEAAQILDLDKARRRAEYLDGLRDIPIPPEHRQAMLLLLCRPGGVSTRDAAHVIFGDRDKYRNTTFRYLKRMEAEGLCAPAGKGRGAGFQATDAGHAAFAGYAAQPARGPATGEEQ